MQVEVFRTRRLDHLALPYAHAEFPQQHWSKIASTNPLERVNKEIKRRSNVIGIFPNDESVIRLVGPYWQKPTTNGKPTNDTTSQKDP